MSDEHEEKTFEVVISGFMSRDEAKAFIRWYEGQGEQMITDWMECARDSGEDIRHGHFDCDLNKTYPLSFINNQVRMHIKDDGE
ncbi:hypothetical protein [Bacteroides sp.]|uniref:hypothetical protein n=1 Tax=Bacteroides sp. TaxID=29523 RepID=UPI00262BA06F|nr:hypothetical protein [Bacteroides sp.]MDD3040572.1 hypothetical protein [Bacteroides sp.]